MIEIAIIGGGAGSIMAEELRGNRNVKIVEAAPHEFKCGSNWLNPPQRITTNKSDRKRDRKNRWR